MLSMARDYIDVTHKKKKKKWSCWIMLLLSSLYLASLTRIDKNDISPHIKFFMQKLSKE